ncbi:hypothetical protein ATKI12_5506 [Kitasatospora sp. Ki12]
MGDVIGLHWDKVVVTAVRTIYGRDETTGRPVVHTSVDVEAQSSGSESANAALGDSRQP